ncbi:MAG: DNA alkylation repair protein, partial [Gemmatimonadota bacterium]|nr:DNA alkylation repair protein [Gemmatimonadota bacterium]
GECTGGPARRTGGGVAQPSSVPSFSIDDLWEAMGTPGDDMVVKAMSWALRELIPVDHRAVERFLRKHDDVLAARVKREVRNKLTTGLKNPRSKGKAARGQDSAYAHAGAAARS